MDDTQIIYNGNGASMGMCGGIRLDCRSNFLRVRKSAVVYFSFRTNSMHLNSPRTGGSLRRDTDSQHRLNHTLKHFLNTV